jgi:hypothetical protein
MSDFFSVMLDPIFETRYPEHPVFLQRLGMSEVAALIADLYNSSRRNLAEVQHLARSYALPMGLVAEEEDGMLAPKSDEALKSLTSASVVLAKVEGSKNGETVSLKDVYDELRKEPRGLGREAQHLLLTALVAQRQIDFVTSKGDRINQRSLDLKIIWDDIIGVAKPAGPAFSAKKLARWAVLVSGDDKIKSLDDKAHREALNAALQAWYSEWIRGRVLRRFDDLADDMLNARIWVIASRCSKLLGAMAETIKAALDDAITLEECLNRIADTFSDSEEQFQRAQSEIVMLDSFIKGTPLRAEVLSYLSGCEITDVEELEEMREQLYHLSDVSYSNPSDASNRELGYLWIKFQRDFSEHFAARHDSVMRSHSLQASYNEIMRSDEWWEFENLARISVFDPTMSLEVSDLRGLFGQLDCGFAVREALQKRPFCRCSFGLSKQKDWERLPERLTHAIQNGLREFRMTLFNEQKQIVPMLEKLENDSTDKEIGTTAGFLIDTIRKGNELPKLSLLQIQVLQKALGTSVGTSDRPALQVINVTEVHAEGEHSHTVEEQTVQV